jgi:hypothetical protein
MIPLRINITVQTILLNKSIKYYESVQNIQQISWFSLEIGTKYITKKCNAISNIPCMRNTKVVITRNFRSAYLIPGQREPGKWLLLLRTTPSVVEWSDQYELPSE